MERTRQRDELNLSRIPVFVFPSNVYFSAHDRDHLKQILTIYNPYEFPIKFRVLSNASTFYNVRPDEGSISSKNSLDLIIRVSTDVKLESNTPLRHKFRIQIFHHNTKQQVGQRDVESIIHFGNLPSHLAPSSRGEADSLTGSSSVHGASSMEPFQQFAPGSGAQEASGGSASMTIFPQGHYTQPNYVVLIVAVCCMIGLLLPYSDEHCKTTSSTESPSKSSLESILPSYLHLSVNQKLLFAYALGLVTMVILRP